MKVKRISDFKMGDKEFFSKTISESDVYLYAGVTGDLAPHHVNADYAKGTRFKERIAHGLLIAGVMSSALTKLVAPRGGHAFARSSFSGPGLFRRHGLR